MAKDYEAKPTRKRAPGIGVEWKVLTVVAVFVAVLEVTARLVSPHMDIAYAHIYELPDLVDEVEQKKTKGQSVLLFGNSLMKYGLLQGEIDRELPESIQTTKMTPVGTTVVDWTFLYKKYFENRDVHPDLIIVGFVGHHIADAAQAYPIRNRRLGRHFLAWEDQPLVWRTEFPNVHDKVQTSLSHFSAILGDQPEHNYYLYRQIIPHYGTGLSLNNDWVSAWRDRRREEVAASEPQQEPPVTFERLGRFIDLMKSHGVEVWFVPMPQPDFYELDPGAKKMVESKGMRWLEARNLCLGEENFSDGYHLGVKGSKTFTDWIKDKLLIRSESGR